ncbi:MAG TPA: hypothetical protein PLO53_00365, partial [Candidatus Hydrogenedentes bacterium]|nr:hypothetical protein [Candidatus Hydrogenedentota bacterium]
MTILKYCLFLSIPLVLEIGIAMADTSPLSMQQPHESITALPDAEEHQVRRVVEQVGPALVRISVVETDYRDGREVKSRSFGSGVVIRE